MSTNDPEGDAPPKPATPKPFTEAELASVTSPPEGDPELEELEAAPIEAQDAEPETPFDKLVGKGKRMADDRVRTIVESLLFVTDRPLSVEQLWEATGIDREKVRKALEKLQGLRREGISGVVLQEVGGGWQLRTDPDSSEYVRRFLKVKPQRLTRAAVETMAIIAYRQPVTRPEIEDIRGVDTGAVLKALLERRLIKILGKKEEVGRPILYGTSREFLEFFAIRDLASLPTLREYQELTEEHQAIVEKEAPPKIADTVEALADPGFQARLDAQNKASEAALAELESAIDGADATSRATQGLLASEAPPPPTEPAV